MTEADGFDAIVLAGGRGSRLGGVRKPEVQVGGRRLLDMALAAVGSARQVVVVGDVAVPDGVLLTREDPPYGGPVAAVEAGFAVLTDPAPWTLLLASDLPDVEAATSALLAHQPGAEDDGVCLVGDDGWLQWLLGRYRSQVLRSRLAARNGITAMYRLLEPLRLTGIDPAGADVRDLDTPEDAARWASSRGPVEW